MAITKRGPPKLLFHNILGVNMALSSQLAMLNTENTAEERAKRSKLAKELVNSVYLPAAVG